MTQEHSIEDLGQSYYQCVAEAKSADRLTLYSIREISTCLCVSFFVKSDKGFSNGKLMNTFKYHMN